MTFTPKIEVLPKEQLEIWKELSLIPDQFILYGGTALALWLGHRESIDFDFFCFEPLNQDRLLSNLEFLGNYKIIQREPNTLSLLIGEKDPVQISFFGVPKLMQINTPEVASCNGVKVASILDISGMKSVAVQKRAEIKDYIDINEIIEKTEINLSEILSAGKKIYGDQFNPEVALKALCYFDDGNVSSLDYTIRENLLKAVREVNVGKLPEI